jgi:hypothetical protein
VLGRLIPCRAVLVRRNPPVHREDIVSVALEAIPEGAGDLPFVRDPKSEPFGQREEDLAEILRFVPDPLPATLDQGDCEFGGDVVVTTSEVNTTIAYGPCRRPRAIERLRAHMLAIINASE